MNSLDTLFTLFQFPPDLAGLQNRLFYYTARPGLSLPSLHRDVDDDHICGRRFGLEIVVGGLRGHEGTPRVLRRRLSVADFGQVTAATGVWVF